jgi:cell division septation protein DedD
MSDLIPPRADGRVELTRSHLGAIAVSAASVATLTFLIGVQVGRLTPRDGAAVAPAAAVALLPPAEDQRQLEALLREVDAARRALPPQIQDDQEPLRFPAALSAEAASPQLPPADLAMGPLLETEAAAVPEQVPPRPASPPAAPGEGWAIQVATHITLSEAQAAAEALRAEGQTAYVVAAVVDGRSLYRVRVGGYTSPEDAEQALAALQTRVAQGELRVAVAP